MEHHITARVSCRTSHHLFRRPDIPLVRLNLPATRQLSVAFLSTCHLVLEWKWLNWSSRSTYLATTFVILDILWFILVGYHWRIWCVRKNCGQRMKYHGATWSVLLLRGGFEGKRKTYGTNKIGSNMISMKNLGRTTTKSLFPRWIFSSAALSRITNNRNSFLHERKDFRCCRSNCHRSAPSSGTKSPLLVAGLPWCPRLAALAASWPKQLRLGNSSTRSLKYVYLNQSLAGQLNTGRGKGTLR